MLMANNIRVGETNVSPNKIQLKGHSPEMLFSNVVFHALLNLIYPAPFVFIELGESRCTTRAEKVFFLQQTTTIFGMLLRRVILIFGIWAQFAQENKHLFVLQWLAREIIKRNSDFSHACTKIYIFLISHHFQSTLQSTQAKIFATLTG